MEKSKIFYNIKLIVAHNFTYVKLAPNNDAGFEMLWTEKCLKKLAIALIRPSLREYCEHPSINY